MKKRLNERIVKKTCEKRIGNVKKSQEKIRRLSEYTRRAAELFIRRALIPYQIS